MISARILAAATSAALAASALTAPQVLAAGAGLHEVAVHSTGFERVGHGDAAGRSTFRDDGSRFQGANGGWGFGHRDGWREARRGAHWRSARWRRHGGYAPGYPYGSYAADGFYDDNGSEGYGPTGFGPPPGFGPAAPYGDSFAMGQPAYARPLAPTLAPSAYGPGPHDGAYAYGYNGYAQTPPLPIGFTPGGWTVMTGRGCGC